MRTTRTDSTSSCVTREQRGRRTFLVSHQRLMQALVQPFPSVGPARAVSASVPAKVEARGRTAGRHDEFRVAQWALLDEGLSGAGKGQLV